MARLNTWILKKVATRKANAESGQGLAEYGLILALIAVVCIGALTALGGGVKGTLSSLTGSL